MMFGFLRLNAKSPKNSFLRPQASDFNQPLSELFKRPIDGWAVFFIMDNLTFQVVKSGH
jgi:hypothetical protein